MTKNTQAKNDEKSRLIYIIRNLPDAGKRLPHGLALRISKGIGMYVCGCSRIGTEPSLIEMRTILECLEEIYAPEFTVMDDEPTRREIPRWVEAQEAAVVDVHFIWRIYWPAEKVSAAAKVLERPRQESLI